MRISGLALISALLISFPAFGQQAPAAGQQPAQQPQVETEKQPPPREGRGKGKGKGRKGGSRKAEGSSGG